MKKKEISKLFADKYFQERISDSISANIERKASDEKKIADEQKVDEEQKIYIGKQIEYYSVLASSWLDSRNKENQASTAIATGGIGLLMALASGSDFAKLNWYFVLLIPIALLAFLVASLVGVYIYRKNSHYLLILKKNEESPKNQLPLPKLKHLDYISVCSLGIGVICSVAYFIIRMIVIIASKS